MTNDAVDIETGDMPASWSTAPARPAKLTLEERLKRDTEQAEQLKKIVKDQRLSATFSGGEYLQFEAWQQLASWNDQQISSQEATPLIDPDDGKQIGWQAVARLVNIETGVVVGSGTGICLKTEDLGKGKIREWGLGHACQSMAQTRAGSKACRMNFSRIVVLAGFKPTPSDEMTGNEESFVAEPLGHGTGPSTEVASRSAEAARAAPTVPAKEHDYEDAKWPWEVGFGAYQKGDWVSACDDVELLDAQARKFATLGADSGNQYAPGNRILAAACRGRIDEIKAESEAKTTNAEMDEQVEEHVNRTLPEPERLAAAEAQVSPAQKKYEVDIGMRPSEDDLPGSMGNFVAEDKARAETMTKAESEAEATEMWKKMGEEK